MDQDRDNTLAVVICSAYRPPILHETLLSVSGQSRGPGQIIVSVPGAEHVLQETMNSSDVTVVFSEQGLTKQRNRAIAALPPEIEIVTFLDDDVELHRDYLDHIGRLFVERRDAILIDGRVLADGRGIGGFSRADAEEIVAVHADDSRSLIAHRIGPGEAYGCNMSVRRRVFDAVTFDERLALYGFMEDRDFAYRCSQHGPLLRCESSCLVHLGVASGRVSERQYGFAQLMNPIYLWRKGSIPSVMFLANRLSRTVLTNTAMTMVPAQRAKRLERLSGNAQAVRALLRGRIAPEDIEVL